MKLQKGQQVSAEELDELMFNVLLHSTKTKTLLKRLKAAHPDKWMRAFGNVSLAYHALAPRAVQVTKYTIGVFDPDFHDSWPWHCHYEDGVFLSKNHRLCKMWKAAEFSSANEAREFFHNWKGKKDLKMEVIETYKTELVNS